MGVNMETKQCCKRVFSGERWDISGHQCQRNAKVIRNGKPYCTIHDPIREERKRKEWDEKWKKEQEERKKKYRRKLAMERACKGVETEVLEKIKVKDLLK